MGSRGEEHSAVGDVEYSPVCTLHLYKGGADQDRLGLTRAQHAMQDMSLAA